MKRKKWNKMVLMCLCFILVLAVPVSAAPGKAKQKKIYREFIQKKTVSMSSTYMLNGKKWTGKTRFKIDAFVLLDMNKDGTYELFTTDNSYNKSRKVVYNRVFTINKKGKIVYLGDFENSTELYKQQRKIFYNYKKKGVVEQAYLYHSKCNALKTLSNKYGLLNTDIRYVYNKPYSSLVKNIKSYPYITNNAANRNKYLK